MYHRCSDAVYHRTIRLCDDLEGWDGVSMGGRLKREGIYVYLQVIHVVQEKLTQHCKEIILHLKNNLTRSYN